MAFYTDTLAIGRYVYSDRPKCLLSVMNTMPTTSCEPTNQIVKRSQDFSTAKAHRRLSQSPDNAARDLYFALSVAQPPELALNGARRFLDESIQESASLSCDLPTNARELDAWIDRSTAEVGARYQQYLKGRKNGQPRAYFATKSQALHFLKAVAPTKTVDGAWLYGLVKHWNDGRFESLIKIYLEELGSGVPEKNHVVLFKKLLATHGCDKWDTLSDTHFVQGAIQLALAHHADHFLPEVIGFNLGYEQLPLHLLITAYELNELGIDPYYFTLHVTVDNADTGHAKSALAGLREAWPVVCDDKRFYERVMNGFKLNSLGASTNSIIASFDLQEELFSIFKEKSRAGNQVHSDYCRVAGRTVNDWLKNEEEIPSFIAALEKAGWIKRGEDPDNSRFWKLLQGDRAEMFGVFNAYELQAIYDWIKGDAQGAAASNTSVTSAPIQRTLTFKARQKLHATLENRNGIKIGPEKESQKVLVSMATADHATDFNAEIRRLDSALSKTASREEAMNMLGELISPARHHTAVGLKATRMFVRMFG